MIIVKLNPTSPGQRWKTKIINKNLFKGKPLKVLCKKLINKSGRNNIGRITVRHKGGRCKRKYRLVDFYRLKDNIFAKVKHIEYDPNRNANIALVIYKDGVKRYILSPKGLLIGDKIISGDNVNINIGNTLLLKNIPNGVKLHCLEIHPGKGGRYIRSAGSYGIIVSRELEHVYICLKSGIIKKFSMNCRATIGEVGNNEYNLIKFGKAGVNRLRGIRPTVRGVAMNPVDHPHGGGEGKTSGGRDPVSPWGWGCKGLKTVFH